MNRAEREFQPRITRHGGQAADTTNGKSANQL